MQKTVHTSPSTAKNVTVTNRLLVENKLEGLNEICQQVFGFNVYLLVEFNVKGKIGGWFCFDPKDNCPIIRLNSAMLAEYGDEFINEVVVHEFVHAVVNHLERSGKLKVEMMGKKYSAHGNNFYGVARKLGVTVSRCHHFKVEPARKVTKYVFEMPCGCRPVVSQNIVTKIQKGQKRACVKHHVYLNVSQAKIVVK